MRHVVLPRESDNSIRKRNESFLIYDFFSPLEMKYQLLFVLIPFFPYLNIVKHLMFKFGDLSTYNIKQYLYNAHHKGNLFSFNRI